MRKIIFILIAGVVAMVGCKNGGEQGKSTADSTKTSAQPVAKPTTNLDDSGTAKLMNIMTDYYGLKNAFVATNAANVGTTAGQLSSSAKSLQGYLLGKDGAPGPLKPFLDTVIMESRAITETTDKTCEKQRVAFGLISSAMYGLVKNADLKNKHVYHQFCPMAFNEKGATWLSDESEIKNPYFGDKMLECGEVTDSLK